ncbi:MAG: anti-sigma B factor antagonist [Sphingobacteriales bacterium]|jgi:anti-sigma B factor antagonist
MKFTIDKKERHTIFKLDEQKLNSVNAPILKSELILLNTEGFKNIILDLNEVAYSDSSGLSSLLVGNRLCSSSGGSLVICNLQPAVEKLITISQLDNVLNIVPTTQEAEDFVMMEEVAREFDTKSE